MSSGTDHHYGVNKSLTRMKALLKSMREMRLQLLAEAQTIPECESCDSEGRAGKPAHRQGAASFTISRLTIVSFVLESAIRWLVLNRISWSAASLP